MTTKKRTDRQTIIDCYQLGRQHRRNLCRFMGLRWTEFRKLEARYCNLRT